MTEETPPLLINAIDRRLTELEAGLQHFREVFNIQQGHLWQRITDMQNRCDQLDEHIDEIDEKMLQKTESFQQMQWRVVGWGGGLLVATLLSIVLKALKLL
jgi:hypothetical protein